MGFLYTSVHVCSWGRDRGANGKRAIRAKGKRGEKYSEMLTGGVLGEGSMGLNPLSGLGRQIVWI